MGFLCGPAPTVAEYVVKNFSWPGVVIFTAQAGKSFALQFGWIVTLGEELCKGFLRGKQLKC